jgi:Zn-dependent protease with chaperone function
MIENFYPVSPGSVPNGFTQPSPSYKSQVVYVLLAMLVFMMLYLAMITASVYLIYWAIMYPMENINKFTLLLKAGSVAMSVMLFVFLLKFLFKRHITDSPLNIEITEKDQPHLFAFIRQLCKETNAPFPHKVFVNHEINACVFYNSTVLSLFLPVKKNLLIGLGLVNTVNLSEFKAVLAHEFGHFAQSSMKLGSYVYMANQIIYSMVHERDKWDELLEQWKGSDIRISVFAWLLMPVVWLIRKCMSLIYQGINLVHASLSREMEFNADRVAVSVTGSNAIINALYKLGPSSEAFDFSNQYLSTAIDHKLYTQNLFFHHTKAVEHLARHKSEFKEALFENKVKPAAHTGFLFTNEEEHLPEMYASHPSNYKREQNAKSVYIDGQADERSAWVLFEQAQLLSEKVTRNLFTVSLSLPEGANFASAEKVHEFIEAELAETTYGSQYQGVYDNRFLASIEINKTDGLSFASEKSADQLKEAYESLYGKELQDRMAGLKNRQKDIQTLSLILQKQDKRKEFILSDGKTYSASQAKELLEALGKEYEVDGEWYKMYDQKVFVVHYLMLENKPAQQQELLRRYEFHAEWQQHFKNIQQIQQEIQDAVQAIVAKGQITEAESKSFATNFIQLKQRLEQVLTQTDGLSMPVFNNLALTNGISKYLLEEPVVPLYVNSIDGTQINTLLHQTSMVIDRMRRIYFKSLGGILSLQEQAAKQYLSEKASV